MAHKNLSGKYDEVAAKEVCDWIKQITGDDVPKQMESFQAAMKNGLILNKLVNAVFDKTANLPEKAKKIARPIKYNTMTAPFKQMENIQVFLTAIEAYGVPKTSLFQTVDLYESRNVAGVVTTILQFGTECQRNEFKGPSLGPKPTTENKREFDEQTLRSGQGIIGLQAGSNKGASQSGMSMGGARHVADIRCDDMSRESQGIVGLQAGSNKGASQSGMTFGGARHVADIKCDDMSRDSQGIIGLQAGSNKGASQSGMTFGGARHAADIKCDDMSRDSQGVIGLQAGSNQGASQSGMTFGGVRHVADIKSDNMSRDSQGIIGLQAGSNQGASQSGMSFGAQRHILDSH